MEEWVTVAAADAIEDGRMLEVDLLGVPVVVVRFGRSLFALSGECPHQGGPLVEGDLEGTILTCPWHAYSFDVETGAAQDEELPDCVSYPVRVWGNDVQLLIQPVA